MRFFLEARHIGIVLSPKPGKWTHEPGHGVLFDSKEVAAHSLARAVLYAEGYGQVDKLVEDCP